MAWNFEAGEVLLFNKPLRWTSFDLVKKVRNLARTKKVGHAGTLDPLATGLMIICTGKKTKEIDSYQAQVKEYTGTIVLGATTPCFDLEMEPDSFYPTAHITEQQIKAAAEAFTGTITQLPPPHSAVKIGGVRAYEMAREGKAPELRPREVVINEFEITGIEMPRVFFRVVCSKGTYIRSLANDFGKHLHSGAYLEKLCRTAIGDFRLANAMELTDFERLLKEQQEP